MIGWIKRNRHRLATWGLTAGTFVAAKLIPATAVIVLGPLSIPVAGLVGAAATGLAAVGVEQSPKLRALLEAVTVKKR